MSEIGNLLPESAFTECTTYTGTGKSKMYASKLTILRCVCSNLEPIRFYFIETYLCIAPYVTCLICINELQKI